MSKSALSVRLSPSVLPTCSMCVSGWDGGEEGGSGGISPLHEKRFCKCGSRYNNNNNNFIDKVSQEAY